VTGEMAGVRTTWFCAKCGASEKTYQLVRVDGEGDALTLPPGWSIEEGRTVCGTRPASDKAAAA
jgi:hypothetical protein